MWQHDNTIKLNKIDFELYRNSIPKCCKLKTYDEHQNMFFCWNLIKNLDDKINPSTNCEKCEFFQSD